MKKLILGLLMITIGSVTLPSTVLVYASEDTSKIVLPEEKNTLPSETNNLNYNNLFIPESRSGNYNFNEYVFLQYKPHSGSKAQPSSNPIWQVKYVSGKKKQGWVYWSGNLKNAGRVGASFQFRGTLK